jgi:putative ABC transport system substrate-binding protein
MRRRDFVTLLGGAAVSWPLAARAQQANKARRIGVLMGPAESDPEAQSEITVFRRALRDLGWKVTVTFGSRIAGPLLTPIACKHLRKSW